ncbi:hypothetical protein CFI11_08085 [Thalassococcus sp. S3]|nr:hypothetical protein CFI11_08085 [Thalassococcus sp. S3]
MQVGGDTWKDVDTALDTLERNGLERSADTRQAGLVREIVEAMQASSKAISFDDVRDLIENIRFRLASIHAMSDLNIGRYDCDYFDPNTGLEPRIGTTDPSRRSEYWAFLHPHDVWDAEWVQTSVGQPSDAIAPRAGAIFPFRGECAGAFQLTVYWGLLNGLGAARFDEMASVFGTMYVGPWRLGNRPNPATLFMQPASLEDPPIPGDYLYFKNKDDYLRWAPDGFWTGLNSMYMGKDMLGTRHYAGMGASWLSETNLRMSLVNAYYHDCYPHTIAHPNVEVRFTERRLLTIPKEYEMPDHAQRSGAQAGKAPSIRTLEESGYVSLGGGILEHATTTVGEVADLFEVDPGDLRQVVSAEIGNAPTRLDIEGTVVVLHYADPEVSRQDPAASVAVHVHKIDED